MKCQKQLIHIANAILKFLDGWRGWYGADIGLIWHWCHIFNFDVSSILHLSVLPHSLCHSLNSAFVSQLLLAYISVFFPHFLFFYMHFVFAYCSWQLLDAVFVSSVNNCTTGLIYIAWGVWAKTGWGKADNVFTVVIKAQWRDFLMQLYVSWQLLSVPRSASYQRAQ